MGKKNKKGKAANAETEKGMPRGTRRESLEIVNFLLEKCSIPFGSGGQEWDDFMDVYGLIETLRKKQQNYKLPALNRDKNLSDFMSWLNSNEVNTETVSIENFEVEGLGLKANRDIECAELFLSVPRSVMITTDTAKKSVLKPLIEEDRILQAMPNVVLALHLLCERSSEDSFWAPYINILPDKYSTPLYFTPDEIQTLKGSPAFSEVLNQFRNIARQYAYFFKLFQGHAESSGAQAIKNYCFDDYRWAVSSVMTRQNQIPGSGGEGMSTALIPLWDMCNHCSGQITTDFNLEKDCSQSYALLNVEKGNQVLIFYGPRSNAELLVHNGFIYPSNQNDRLAVKLGISKNDHLYAMKSEILSRLAMLPSRIFNLHVGADPVDSELLAFLRVFSMDEEALKVRLFGEGSSEKVHMLKDFDDVVSLENEKNAWAFLETRSMLLLRAYCTSIQEDEEVLLKGGLSKNAELAVQLRLCEKHILMTTTEYAKSQKTRIEEMMIRVMEAANRPTLEGVDEIEDEMQNIEISA